MHCACNHQPGLQAAAEVLDRDGKGQSGDALAAFAIRENLRSARHQLAEQQRLTRQQSSLIGELVSSRSYYGLACP